MLYSLMRYNSLRLSFEASSSDGEKPREYVAEIRAVYTDVLPRSSAAQLIAVYLEKPYIGFPEFCGPLN